MQYSAQDDSDVDVRVTLPEIATMLETERRPMRVQAAEEELADRAPRTDVRLYLAWKYWLPVAILGLLVVVLYGHIAIDLVRIWLREPDNSHGVLIPFFAMYLLWDRRGALRQTPIAPAWAGIWLVASAMIVLLTGALGADSSLSRISFVMLLAGLVWTLLGVRMLTATLFPILVLTLAIPMPTILLNQVTFPLQLLSSEMASELLSLAGVPVLREGNVIQLASMQLEVAEACSGIRSLVSLFTVAIIYGYFFEAKLWGRVLLAAASLPIAIAANALRIFGTGLCVQYLDPEKAFGFFHEFSGWLLFLLSMVFLYLVHRITNLFKAGERRVA